MRILQFSYDHPFNPWVGGGGARGVHEVCRRLSKRHRVKVVSGGWAGCEDAKLQGNLHYCFSKMSRIYPMSRLYFSAHAVLLALRSNYDIIADSVSPFSPTFSASVSGKPCVAQIALDPFEAITKYPKAAPVLRKLVYLNLQSFEHFITWSHDLEESLRQKLGWEVQIRTIPPGVEPRLFGVNVEERNYLLFLGRLDIDHKGLDYLLDAYMLFRREHPEIRLLIAGGSGEPERLRRMVRERRLGWSVELVGEVHGKVKRDLLRKCLFVCMPSRREGWPLVAIEAAACRKPVIGFKVTGLRNAVRKGRTGLLVEKGNVTKLVEAMQRVVENRALRHRLGSEGREWAKNFTWEKTAKQYEAFYRSLI